MLRPAFEAGNFIKPLENNRQTGIFEEKETRDERDLRMRQVGLVKLFSEINLQPSRINATMSLPYAWQAGPASVRSAVKPFDVYWTPEAL